MMSPNKRFQPTASLAALASRRLKRVPLARLGGKGENSRCARARCASTHGPDALGKAVVGLPRRMDGDVGGWPHDHSRGHGSHAGTRRFPMGR
jgi:hypothetical protein